MTLDRTDSVASLAADIGQRLGEPLSVDPELANCMVYMHLERADGESALARLASAVDAQWEIVNGRRRLDRAGSFGVELRRRETDHLTQIVTTQMDGLAKYKKRSTPEEYAKAVRDSRSYGPIEGVIPDLLKDIGAAEIAKTKPFEIRVFSNQPTSAESALPPSTGEVIAKYRKEEQTLTDLVMVMNADEVDGYTRQRLAAASQGRMDLGRVILLLYRTPNLIFTGLTVYDRNGSIHGWASAGLPTKEPSTQVGGDDAPMRWSDATQEMLATLRGETKNSSLVTKLGTLEPLEIQAVPGLVQMSRGRSIVVPLPDAVVPALYNARPKGEQDFAQTLLNAGVRLKKEEGWLTGKLVRPLTIADQCLPRAAMKRWIATLGQPAAERFRGETLLYTVSGNAAPTSSLDNWYREIYAKAAFGESRPDVSTSHWLTFFLGSLSDGDWKRLIAGERIDLPTGEPSTEWLYQLSWDGAKALTPAVAVPDIVRIGTYAFPGGMPPGATITTTPSTGIFVRNKEFPDWISLEEYGNLTAAKLGQATPEAIAREVEACEIGKQGGLKFCIQYTPNLSITEDQPMSDISVIAQVGSLAEWPKSLREELISHATKSYALQHKATPASRP